MKYAFAEVPSILQKIGSISYKDPARQYLLSYLCALFAELPYHHIPQLEFDKRKRAKIISSEAYNKLRSLKIKGGHDVRLALAQLSADDEVELPKAIVAETEGCVAVGMQFENILFIGFRGTVFTSYFDWWINGRGNKIHLKTPSRHWPRQFFEHRPGLFHAGFAKEAERISKEIDKEFTNTQIREIDEVYLCGHSLGGAVAAVAQEYIRYADAPVYMYGAPRYCDDEAYAALPYIVPRQYRRSGDMVPTVPPLWMGYGEHVQQYDLNGNELSPVKENIAIGSFRWMRFAGGCFKSHSMERYRGDLGRTANIVAPDSPLIPLPTIKGRHLL